jgi:hypothetical protein
MKPSLHQVGWDSSVLWAIDRAALGGAARHPMPTLVAPSFPSSVRKFPADGLVPFQMQSSAAAIAESTTWE